MALLVVPLLFLCALEVSLRLAGWGYSTDLFRPLRISDKDYLVENESFSRRFFPLQMARTPGPFRMLADKPPGTHRIFVFGESAAMGDPEPAYGAWRYLEVLLRAKFPQEQFEIINTAVTAINSHVILPMAKECAQYKGDIWIIYMGNNEMVGPFGAATILGPRAPPLGFVRLSLALQKTRVGQLLAAARRAMRGANRSQQAWEGMQMFTANRVWPGESRRRTVYRSFEKNLHDILKAGLASGATIILNTVVVNLKDCPPFASLAATNLPTAEARLFEQKLAEGLSLESNSLPQAALESYRGAASLLPLSAEVQFHMGDCFLKLTNSKAARICFQAACDLDALPFRADSHINNLIAEAAKNAADPRVILCDPAVLPATNSGEIPGEATFYEHVHFTLDGNYRLALMWATDVERLLPQPVTKQAAPGWLSQEQCERRLGLTDWNRCAILDEVISRLKSPPLVTQFGQEKRLNSLQSVRTELGKGLTDSAAVQARAIYLEAIKLAPDDFCLHGNFADFLASMGDVKEEAAQRERVHQLIPQDPLASYRLGELYARQGDFGKAEATLSQSLKLSESANPATFALAEVHAAQGKLDLALKELEELLRAQPQATPVWYAAGMILAAKNRRGEAIDHLRRAIELQPENWQFHEALGNQLATEGDFRSATREFEMVVRLKPELPSAHLNLAMARIKQGAPEEAKAELERVLQIEPTNSRAAQLLQQVEALRKEKGR